MPAQQVEVVDLAGRGGRLVRLVEALQHGAQQPLGTCRAARRRRRAGRPGRRRSRPPRSGVYGSTVGRSASKPMVWAWTYASSIQPLRISSRSRPFISATLVPLRTAPGGRRPPGRPASAAGRPPASRRVRAATPVEHAHPQHGLGLGAVVAPQRDGVAVVDVGVGAGLAVGPEARLQRRGRGRRAQPGVAVHVRRADAGLADHGERVVLLEEQLAAGVEAEAAPAARRRRAAAATARRCGPSPCPSRSRRARRPPRTSGRVSRSGEWLACQPNRSFGSTRPWLTRSAARPRTPTIRPSLTAMSSASPLECRIDADCTHRSTAPGQCRPRGSCQLGPASGHPVRRAFVRPTGSAIRSEFKGSPSF